MTPAAQRSTPSVPAARPISSQAKDEFTSLKQQLDIESWEMTPNEWDKIQLAYVKTGMEQQARSFVKAIELQQQEIL